MSQTSSANSQSETLTLPWDLSQWVDKGLLWQWSGEVVSSLHWDRPELEAYLAKHPQYRPQVLLRVLTWCYVTGIFESSEITEACAREPFLRQACPQVPISEKEAARFRRENLGLLKWIMVRVMRRAIRTKFGLDPNWFPPGLRRWVEDAAKTRLDLARQYDRGSSGF